ncbi:oleosin 16.4 kDa [Solanum verrucosum]|uniref:oleosin 16.4 kDa n=1 Tax=Solanum verrucosum TaxID=315347 RepID=UPI0020D114F6|nr:oleosin 16.4 kDa [Solanum verrucosum]
MAENREMMEVSPTRKTKIWATIAGIAIEVPILGLMGFSFLASIILLVVTSPLLVIFSPLLIGAAAVFGVAMAGFGVAGVTAGLGLSSFVLVYRSVIKGRITGGEYGGGADDAPVIVDKMIQQEETEEEEHDTEVAGTEDRTEAIKQQQPQQGSTSSEPVHVDKIVELFESLKEHPHDQNETATIVHVVTVEVDDDDNDDELEENQHNKDMATSADYLQQNVPRQIPQET